MALAPVMDSQRERPRRGTFPVVEVFGPTVQGEGPDAGVPAYFVRFGGCDWRCTWCDSMYAVDPAEVRRHAERMTAEDIDERLAALPAGPELVVLTGGNPALHDLDALVARLRARGLRVAVETQGSRWKPWLGEVDRLVVSPKPPSSGMATPQNETAVGRFLARAAVLPAGAVALKIVVFDDGDLAWAAEQHRKHPDLPLHLSAGTDQALGEDETIRRLRDRYRWLCEAVSRTPELAAARVLPQLHVIAWGTARGV